MSLFGRDMIMFPLLEHLRGTFAALGDVDTAVGVFVALWTTALDCLDARALHQLPRGDALFGARVKHLEQ